MSRSIRPLLALLAIGATVLTRPVRASPRPKAPPREPVSPSLLWDDYKIGVDVFKLLADIRFKLLAFVPTIAGAAIVLLSRDFAALEKNPVMVLIVGVLGVFVTIGVIFYDQRNSQISNATFFRLQWLESELGISGHGQFTTRPGRQLRLLGLWTIWHDRGLALIYGSVMGAWFFPIVYSGLTVVRIDGIWRMTKDGVSGVSAAILGVIFVYEVHRLDRQASIDRPTFC